MNTPEISDHAAYTGGTAEEGWYAIRQRANHALTHFGPPQSSGTEAEQWHHAAHWAILAAELWETPDSIEIGLEVPGMAPDQFEVEVMEGMLLIRGTRTYAEAHEESRYFIRERAFGRFERAFHLPAAVNEDEARAKYRDGVLRISLPKSRAHTENRIRVEGPS